MFYYNTNEMSLAKQTLNKCIQINKLSIRPIQLLGYIYLKENDILNALKCY